MSTEPTLPNSLQPPPIAKGNPKAVEVLRVWTAPGSPQQVTLQTTWEDPGTWGLILVDAARHAARAYSREGHDPYAVLIRIREIFDVEWASPTDEVQDITDNS
jgi:hypothetical protein